MSITRGFEREAPYRAYLFGYLRMYRGDHRVTLESSRKKGLHILLWFLLNPGKPCSADQFVDTLWPETEPDKAIRGFDVNMHVLKRLLEPELGPRERSSFIQHHANRVYTFESADLWWTDVADLELLFRRGHAYDIAGDVARALFYYRRVSGYVSQGPLLDGESSSWLERYRHKYALMCSQALTRLMQIDIDSGTDEEAPRDGLPDAAARAVQPVGDQGDHRGLPAPGQSQASRTPAGGILRSRSA